MPVNNIELVVGQKWKTRGGEEVEIVGNDGHSIYPWGLSNGACVTNKGQVWELQEDNYDLITLIQDEHGFIPWNGGECPVGYGVEVEVEFRDTYKTTDDAGNFCWNHNNSGEDIIAYRVVKQEEKQAGQSKEVIKMNQKYTVKDVLYALDTLSEHYVELDLEEQIEEYLAMRESADYKLYLELKAKFEKE